MDTYTKWKIFFIYAEKKSIMTQNSSGRANNFIFSFSSLSSSLIMTLVSGMYTSIHAEKEYGDKIKASLRRQNH